MNHDIVFESVFICLKPNFKFNCKLVKRPFTNNKQLQMWTITRYNNCYLLWLLSVCERKELLHGYVWKHAIIHRQIFICRSIVFKLCILVVKWKPSFKIYDFNHASFCIFEIQTYLSNKLTLFCQIHVQKKTEISITRKENMQNISIVY